MSSQCVKFGQSYEILSCHLLKEVPIQSPEIFKRYRGSLDIISFEDFRSMKIHIFALRWRDVIKRSSQLRTLLKRVVVNRT